MEGLKPCPFCGSTNLTHIDEVDTERGERAVYIRCQACGCHGPWYRTDGNAERFWNLRPDTAP